MAKAENEEPMEPKIRHILALSGGKDSTALAIYLRDRVPEMEYVFCDTHKELPETYEYLLKIEAYLGKPIVRLCDERGFDHWLTVFNSYLPSTRMRWCTKLLKIKPFEKYVGDDEVHMYVGIRGDEDREAYISTKPNIHPVYPFKEDGIDLAGVQRILDESGIGFPRLLRLADSFRLLFLLLSKAQRVGGPEGTSSGTFRTGKSLRKDRSDHGRAVHLEPARVAGRP